MFSVVGDRLNHFHIVSETPYSSDTVGCELERVILVRCFALKRTGKYTLESKVMCLFFSASSALPLQTKTTLFEGVSINLANGLLDKITPRYHVICFVTC